jgi:hypothetical protein
MILKVHHTSRETPALHEGLKRLAAKGVGDFVKGWENRDFFFQLVSPRASLQHIPNNSAHSRTATDLAQSSQVTNHQ